MQKNKWLLGVIVLDLIWSSIAWVHDFPVISGLPWYLAPFIIICPVFPLLLAIIWWGRLRQIDLAALLPWAALPGVVYAILAPVFYGADAYYNGFSWINVGQVLWVWFYGLQGAYVVWRTKAPKNQVIGVICYLIIALTVQYQTLSLGYLDLASVPHAIVLGLYSIGLISTVLVGGLWLKE